MFLNPNCNKFGAGGMKEKDRGARILRNAGFQAEDNGQRIVAYGRDDGHKVERKQSRL